MPARRRYKIFVAPEVDDLLDAVRAVDGERAEDCEIKEQDDQVEGVELVERADVSPGFIDEIVEKTLEEGLRRRPQRGWPWRRCWGLKNHELRYVQKRKILPYGSCHCEVVGN